MEIVKAKRYEWERNSFAEMGNQRLIDKTRIDAAEEILSALTTEKGAENG